MRAFIATLSLLLATAASAAPQGAKGGCVVPLPIFYTLDYEFTLITHAPGNPSLHQKTITVATSGKAVLDPAGDVFNMTLTDSALGVDFPKGVDPTAYLQVPQKTTWRQVAFNAETAGRLKVQAGFSCLEDDRAVTEVWPYQDAGAGLAWCVKAYTGVKVLAVEEFGKKNDCTAVRLIVTDGVRPV